MAQIGKLLDKKIYKVIKLVNNKVDSIYIFYGKKDKKGKDDTDILKEIFTEDEMDELPEDPDKIIWSEQRIYLDDSISSIKIKIIIEMLKKHNYIAHEEIYLFYKKIEKFNTTAIYQTLTKNKEIELTTLRLDQFIKNIHTNIDDDAFIRPAKKQVYSYDDMFKMKLDNTKYIINKVLGQKQFIVDNEYPYICNPYDVKEYDPYLERTSRKSLITLNNNLLLDSGDVVNNTIYLCLAKDVLSYAQQNGISEQNTLNLYYPFIYKGLSINSLGDLEKQTPALIKGNNRIFNLTKKNDNTINLFNNVDMFYNVYELGKSPLEYVTQGIKYIKAIMKPDFNVKIPLDLIFKIVHATKINPLIKYNPASRQENVFRLYTDNVSTDSRKIPYLKKVPLLKLMKTIGRTKSVSIYI